jgi:phage gp36-like protein
MALACRDPNNEQGAVETPTQSMDGFLSCLPIRAEAVALMYVLCCYIVRRKIRRDQFWQLLVNKNRGTSSPNLVVWREQPKLQSRR